MACSHVIFFSSVDWMEAESSLRMFRVKVRVIKSFKVKDYRGKSLGVNMS